LRARDEALGRSVALKVLAPALAGDAEFRERFVRESRAVAAVDHPHIIPVYAAGEASGVLYLAMRFVVGGDLSSVVRREGLLPGDRAVFLLSPIAAALDAAHAAGLVHGDVKPANILVDVSPGRPEHPYLSDFGLAKGTSSSADLTGTGQFLGTPDCAAPEQIAGKPARPQTDQYALACVAFTILTGTLPFARAEPMAVLWAQMYDPPPPATTLRPDLPAAVGRVLARALAKDSGDRFESCGEFVNAMRTALGVSSQANGAAQTHAAAPAPCDVSLASDTVTVSGHGAWPNPRHGSAVGVPGSQHAKLKPAIRRSVRRKGVAALTAILLAVVGVVIATMADSPASKSPAPAMTAIVTKGVRESVSSCSASSCHALDVTVASAPAGADMQYACYSGSSQYWPVSGTTDRSWAGVNEHANARGDASFQTQCISGGWGNGQLKVEVRGTHSASV
jgi:serine/threonine protein kinase